MDDDSSVMGMEFSSSLEDNEGIITMTVIAIPITKRRTIPRTIHTQRLLRVDEEEDAETSSVEEDISVACAASAWILSRMVYRARA